jgi:hypothetical protein
MLVRYHLGTRPWSSGEGRHHCALLSASPGLNVECCLTLLLTALGDRRVGGSSSGQESPINTEGYNLDALVAHLEALRTVDEASGEVAFKCNLFFHEVVTVFHRAIMFEGDIPERDLMGIVGRTLFRSAKAGSLQTGPLLGEISRGLRGFLERPDKEFIIVTSLSGFST